MKLRHLLMSAGLIVSAGLVIFGDKTPKYQLVDSVSRDVPTGSPGSTSSVSIEPAHNLKDAPLKSVESKVQAEPVILVLRPRVDPLNTNGAENSLFGNQNWTPPAPPPPPPPPPPPTAPTLPFTYAGKRWVDGAWEVFLAKGDNMLYVHANSVVDTNYRIDTISPPTLTLTYIPLNIKQNLSIGDAE